jgi:hypothetical protein
MLRSILGRPLSWMGFQPVRTGGLPPVTLSLPNLSGVVCPATSPRGCDLASAASRARFTAKSDFSLCRFPIPQRRFSHIHFDLVGPLQSSNNCWHILTVIDHTSKWMEAIPLVEMSAAACTKALTYLGYPISGCPK